MSGTVTPLRTCQCGAPGAPLTIEGDDGAILHGFACDACISKVNTTLNRVRPVFAALIACGVPKTAADETMAFLLDRIDP